MSSFRLSKQAESDLVNIATYTIQNFGIKQARQYRDQLFRVFELMADFPQIGSDQSHIKLNIRRHVHGTQAIYYRVEADQITILRILGSGEDPLELLG